jgi:signal transduction histidine kinase
LAVAIALVTLLAVGATFLALYSGTSSRLRAQIDAQLRTQAAEWHVFTAHDKLSPPARLEHAASRFIAAQRYHAEALIIAVQVVGGHIVTNNAELVAREAHDEGFREATGLLNSKSGLATVPVEEAGPMRVLALPIQSDGHRVGTLRVANPLTPLQQAQASLRRTFIVVAIVAVAVAIAAGIGLASLIAAPLRRIARVAAAVDAGDLSLRSGPVAAGGEVGVLSEAVDRMLDRLERAFKRQRDFVSDASHELRTPLSVLRAQIELLDRAPETVSRHEAILTLLRRLDELDRLVSDMLTLASAEAGQLIEPRTIDLAGFFEDLRRDLPLFGERDFQLESTGGTLEGDPDRLTQVLRNLVRNAVAHTEPGDRVTVTSRPRDDHLEICISDSGPGIPPDQLEHIFERFYRLDRGRDRGGSGLGLAIARAIVEAHGGRIRAESAPDQGATFRIELPGYSQ